MLDHDSDVGLAMALACAAHGATDPGASAADVLDELWGYAPAAGAALTAFDPVAGTHTVLGSTGYPSEVLAHLCSSAFLVDDVGYRLLVDRPATRARSWRDVHLDYAQAPSATRVFRPAGYLGGVTARLTTRDGRYTGDLHLSTADPDLPSPVLTATLHHVAPVLAAATDVTRRLGLLLGDLDPDVGAAVVAHDGEVTPVPGRAVPVGLSGGDDLVGRVVAWRDSAAASGGARFLQAGRDGWFRARLVAVAGGTLVALEPVSPPYRLSARELQVLTLVTDGLLNASVARRLGISERTAAHHVEHVLDKLDVPSRTVAARRAVEEGLRELP